MVKISNKKISESSSNNKDIIHQNVPNFKAIEQKWQKKWNESKIFEVKEDSKKKKFYCLEMFPYPSASFLHIGHVRNYTIGDVIARHKRMQGFNVLYPMGYDSFGLPAENAAKKEGVHPKTYTEASIKKIIEYQKALGNSYDWNRVIATHEPEYYKWNQYFFLKFLEKGLVYRKKAPVNWCPSCNSVLANEEVVQGKCWRHEDVEVEEKELEQWFLKTTQYAQELLEDIEKLEWSDRIKHLQRNWIGKSQGVLIDFPIKNINEKKDKSEENKNDSIRINQEAKLQVFTTRPDTIFGVTFVVVSSKHKLLNKLIKDEKIKKQVEEFSKKFQDEEEKDKEGIFLGSYVINPFTNEEVPIYAANFVVSEYGTGAVMAVPAHDKRDFEFAKKYKIKIKTVIAPKDPKTGKAKLNFEVNSSSDSAYVDEGILVNSGQFNTIYGLDAIQKISKFIENKKWGKITTQYKLRDWLISRQRYWGTPIPIIYCDNCGVVPVSQKDLPVLLPEKVDFKKDLGNPLNHAKEWIETKCPNCKSKARRETDTMGGFVDSSWYFLRYCSPKDDGSAFDIKAVDYWMPVDQYIGGIEHAVGHLIYSRFFTKALRDLKMLKFDEPFTKLFNQGILYKGGHKMSKSFGNIVTQNEISDKHGIDTARLFLMSVASPESDIEWSDKGIDGTFRLLQRIWKLTELLEKDHNKNKKENNKDEHQRNLAIKNYTEHLEKFKFNIAIIELTQYVDYLLENPTKKGVEDLLKMLSPFAPHTAEEIWSKIGNKSFISIEKWPKYDESKIKPEIKQAEILIKNSIDDIRNLLNLLKLSNPKEIKLFVSEKWKYNFFNEFKSEFEKTRNVGEIIKSLMKHSELKQYGKEISSIIPKLVNDQSKIPKFILNQEDEFKELNENKTAIEKEFNTKVSIFKAEQSTEQKAKSAAPGKPAILIK